MFFHSLNSADSGREIRAQPAIGGLVCKATDGRQAEVDSGRRIFGLFEADEVSGDDGFVKSKARFRAVPVDELADGVIVTIVGNLVRSGCSGLRISTVRDPVISRRFSDCASVCF